MSLKKIICSISLLLSACMSAANIELSNDRYRLNFNTENASFDVTETASGVVRTFSSSFYVIWKASKPSLSLAEISEDFNYKTVAYGGSTDLFSTNAGSFTLRETPVSIAENEGVISLVFQDYTNYQLTARIYLPAGEEEPVVESSLKALSAGYFSVGYYGAPELDRVEAKELFQPLPFTGLRVPASSYLTPAFLATLPGTFLTVGAITYGVFAEPSEFPFNPLPCTLARSPFGVALKNRSGYGKELKPMVWAPIIGNSDSQLGLNATKKFKFCLYVAKGSMTAAYEDIARRRFGFGDFRHNDLGSLNKAMNRMIDYAMTTEWGVFKEEMKGCSYDTDVPNSVKNTSALPMFAAAFIADREDVYQKRALPVMEFLLSRENTMYAGEETGGAGGQTATNSLGKPCMNYSEMLSLYNISGKKMAALLPIAGANKKGSLLSNEITLKENFSLFRATGQPSVYNDLVSGTNEYVSEEIAVKPSDFSYVNHQKNSFWTSIAPKFVELYEIYRTTGDVAYLEAARQAARIYAYHIWMAPRVVPGDSTLVNAGNKAPRYRGTGNIAIPEEKAPNWRLSEMGLHCEAGGTSTSGHRAIFTANFAGYLLRIGSLTRDTFLLDIGKAGVIGRYTNFPGYHINTDRTTVYEKPDFPLRPLEQLTSTSMHYSHVWTQINLMYDYLVSDVAARTFGEVDFPGQYVQNIVQMQNQVYVGDGVFYGDQGLTLWMPAGIVETDNEELNYIAAYGNGKFYIVFTNQCGQPVNTEVTIGSLLPDVNGKNFDLWRQNEKTTGGTVSGNRFQVSVEPNGVTAVAISGVAVHTDFQQKLLTNTTRNQWTSCYEPSIAVGNSRAILLNPSDSLTRLFLFSTDAKGLHTTARLDYSIDGGAWKQMTDNVYPFEFSVDVNDGASVEYKLTIDGNSSPVYKTERLKPTATLSGWTSVDSKAGADLPVIFTGTPPFSITYAENDEEKRLNGIDTTFFLLKVQPRATSRYKLLKMHDATGTEGLVSGDAKVVVTDAYDILQSFAAVKDAQTYKASASRNYGSEAEIELKGSATYRRDLFYGFHLPALSPDAGQRVLLRLWMNETSRLDEPYLTTLVKATSFTGSWEESSITWNNQPAVTNGVAADTVAVSYLTPVPGYVLLDVTSLIKPEFSGDLNLKLGYFAGEDVASLYFATKENADPAKHPCLLLAEPVKTSVPDAASDADIIIVPTYVNDFFEVKGRTEVKEITVYDLAGKQLIRSEGNDRVRVSGLSPGIYEVLVRDAAHRLYHARIIRIKY